jgi:hypothetical protein
MQGGRAVKRPCVVLTLLAALAGTAGAQEVYGNLLLNNDGTTNLQNEQQIVANPTDPLNLVAVWRDFRLGYRRVAYAATTDGGKTWAQALYTGTPYTRDSDPGLTVDRFGTFYAVVLAFESTSQPNGLFVYRSTDGGLTWSGPYTVIDDVPSVFEDKELIACDRSGGFFDGNLYVAWARFGFNQEVQVARSTDGGETFQAPVFIESGYLQWPVPVVGVGGVVHVAWVNMGSSSLRIASSSNGGASFGSPRTICSLGWSGYGYINGNITVFSYPAMAVDLTGGPHHGRLYLAYMDDAGPDMDIFLRYSDDAGITWSSALRVNNDIPGNGRDQFHPWVDVDANGDVGVVWLDRRLDPSNWKWDCYLAVSTNGGASFGPSVRVSTVSSDPSQAALDTMGRAGLIGEYIGLAMSGGYPYPLWTDTRNGHQDCYVGLHIDLLAPDILNLRLVSAQALLTWAPVPAAPTYNVYRDTHAHFDADIGGGSNLVASGVTDQEPGLVGIQWQDPFPTAGTPGVDYFYRITADVSGHQTEASDPAGVLDFWTDTSPQSNETAHLARREGRQPAPNPKSEARIPKQIPMIEIPNPPSAPGLGSGEP